MSPSVKTAAPTRRHSSRFPFVLAAVLIVAFLAAWPLISEPGLLYTRGGGDSPFLLQRLHQMEVALRDGHFPVRWMRDANYGFGYPFFNYYAPLSIVAATLFRFLGYSYVRSIELAQLFGFLIAAVGVYLLVRRWYRNEWAALLASVAYTVAPFHLVNVYVRGDSLAEFWAMAIYPWVILAADRLLTVDGNGFPYGRVVAFAVAYAGLILSHNISALIFSPFLLLYVFLRWIWWLLSSPETDPSPSAKRLGRSLFPLVVAALLALALAAWFFWPALAEETLAQLEPVTGGYFHFSNHFRDSDLVQNSWIFDFTVSGGNAFRMGLIQAIATLLGVLTLIYISFWRREIAVVPVVFILLALAISTFMVTSFSRLLWEFLPLLSFAQFPWRFLSVQAFVAALAIGALALLPYCRVITTLVAFGLIASSFSGLGTDTLLLNDQDITAESLARYEWYTGNIGSTVSAEYLPQTVQPRFFTSAWLNSGKRANARALEGELIDAQLLELSTDRQSWNVQIGQGGATIVFPTMAWPGWQAAIGDDHFDLRPAPGSGHILLELPPGEHLLTLEFTRTAVRRAAELLSLGALIVTLWLMIKARRPIQVSRPTVVIVLLLAGFLLLFRFWPPASLSAGSLTWDFAQMAYLHHDQAGVPFSSGTTLLSYEYDRDVVAAGQDLTITLSFSEANDESVSVALGLPAMTWPTVDPQPPPIAEESGLLDSKQLRLRLTMPENAPSGLFVPRLTMDVGRPLLPSGGLRGDLFLRPLHVTNDRPAMAGNSPLDVYAVDVQLRDPTTLDVQLVWTTQEPLSQNYVASLLLVDRAGNWLAQLDTQPGYGFLPSSEWLPGTAVNDWLALGFDDNLPQQSPLTLIARLYEVDSGMVVLTRRLGEVLLQDEKLIFEENRPVYSLPDELAPLAALFDDRIMLHGYDLQRETNNSWNLTLYWQTLEPVPDDVVRFIHLFDPRTEEIVFQDDGHPRNNSYPISQWSEGEVVADSITIQLKSRYTDEYRIGVGFYWQDDAERIPAVEPETGAIFQDGRVLLPQTITSYSHR